jgi:hypothetical protein
MMLQAAKAALALKLEIADLGFQARKRVGERLRGIVRGGARRWTISQPQPGQRGTQGKPQKQR